MEIGKLTVDDIAKGLHNVRRFNGQHPLNPSVCEHSLTVYGLAKFYEKSPRIQAACLFHDCAEALLGDISSPVKHEMRIGYPSKVSDFDTIEANWQEEIMHNILKFYPTPAEWKVVKKYDEMAFAHEVCQWVNHKPYSVTTGNQTDPVFEFILAYNLLVKELGY